MPGFFYDRSTCGIKGFLKRFSSWFSRLDLNMKSFWECSVYGCVHRIFSVQLFSCYYTFLTILLTMLSVILVFVLMTLLSTLQCRWFGATAWVWPWRHWLVLGSGMSLSLLGKLQLMVHLLAIELENWVSPWCKIFLS